jgi:hypothetical protein
MNWTEQAEEMMKSWTENQKKLWDSFFANAPDLGSLTGEKVWEQTVDAGETATKNNLAAQLDWLQMWVDQLDTMEGVPDQVKESAKQYQEMTKQWVTAQESMWANWFEMLKKFDPSQYTMNWSEVTQDPFKTWQESAKNIMDTQATWLQSWAEGFGTTSDDEG